MKLSNSCDILKKTWQQESEMAEKRSFGSKLLRIGLGWNFAIAAFAALTEAAGLLSHEKNELLLCSVMCLFVFFMTLDILRRSAYIFFSDRCSGRNIILELAPCGYGANFLVKIIKIVLPWCIETLAAGAVFFIRDLLIGGDGAPAFGFLTVSVFGMIGALGAGMAWSCRRDFTAGRCSRSAAVFFGVFLVLFLICSADGDLSQAEMTLWAVSLFCLFWLPSFNFCSGTVCLLLSAAAAVPTFFPTVRSCSYGAFEYAVPYVAAAYVYDLKAEASQAAGGIDASAPGEDGRGKSESGAAGGGKGDCTASEDGALALKPQPAEAALERILSCGFLSLALFAAGLGCLRLKSREPL